MPTPTQKIDLFDSQGMDDPPPTEEVATSYLQQLEGLEGLARREAVNNPPHYNQGNIEVITPSRIGDLTSMPGNVVKYVARHRHKADALEDLKKAPLVSRPHHRRT